MTPEETKAYEHLAIALACVEKVIALHYEWEVGEHPFQRCHECGKPWPCPTVRLLNGEE